MWRGELVFIQRRVQDIPEVFGPCEPVWGLFLCSWISPTHFLATLSVRRRHHCCCCSCCCCRGGCQLPNQFQLQPSTLSDYRPASHDKELLAGGAGSLLREETLRQSPRRTPATAAASTQNCIHKEADSQQPMRSAPVRSKLEEQ